MILDGEQQHITESYVSVPPALTITDETGAVWTLGFRSTREDEGSRGEFSFNVLRNGRETGEVASRIERRNNRIRVFTRQGWKWMRSQASDSPTRVFGIGARVKVDSMPVGNMQIIVTVWRGQPSADRPVVSFGFDSLAGGLQVLSSPLQCKPGEWLSATIRPADADAVEVMAYLGQQVMRAIPIVHPVIVEGR